MTVPLRRARAGDIPALARLWHTAWHEAHAAFVPRELRALRSLDDFRRRLATMLDETRMAQDDAGPLGFCAIDGDELDQIYLAPRARGSGLAAALLEDAETRIAATGAATARLLCLPENARALRFYGRHGWRETGIEQADLKTADGVFPLPVLVLTKALAPAP